MKQNCNRFVNMATHRISLEERSTSKNAYGAEEESWTEKAKLWAIIKPSSGSEAYFAERRDSKTSHTFIIRWIEELAKTNSGSKYRINYDGRIFGINYVINGMDMDCKTEGKFYQKLSCLEGATT